MENPFQEQKPAKPTLLLVLCVLTFIGSGINIFSNFITAAFFDMVCSMMDASPMFKSIEGMDDVLDTIVAAGPFYYAIVAVLSAVSFIGALLMFRLKKSGFHFYAAAQILLLILPFLFGLGTFSDIKFPLLLTILFVGGYATQLKYMTPHKGQDQSHHID